MAYHSDGEDADPHDRADESHGIPFRLALNYGGGREKNRREREGGGGDVLCGVVCVWCVCGVCVVCGVVCCGVPIVSPPCARRGG
jgi:hypothetical protein